MIHVYISRCVDVSLVHDTQILCACGLPLHYSDPGLQALVEDLIDLVGPDMNITVTGRTFRVPRHYIALHGVNAQELPKLGFPEVL